MINGSGGKKNLKALELRRASSDLIEDLLKKLITGNEYKSETNKLTKNGLLFINNALEAKFKISQTGCMPRNKTKIDILTKWFEKIAKLPNENVLKQDLQLYLFYLTKYYECNTNHIQITRDQIDIKNTDNTATERLLFFLTNNSQSNHNKAIYIGDFKGDKYEGHGELISPNGTIYKGEFKEGEFSGIVSYTDGKTIEYKGDFQLFPKVNIVKTPNNKLAIPCGLATG